MSHFFVVLLHTGIVALATLLQTHGIFDVELHTGVSAIVCSQVEKNIARM